MQIKHLVSASGHASSWNGVAEHHKHFRAAKRMVEIPSICRFVKSTELPELKHRDDGSSEMESREYYEINKEWVTTEQLEALRGVGLNPTVERVELHDATWTAAIENKWVRAAFIGWNVVLASVVLTQGGVL